MRESKILITHNQTLTVPSRQTMGRDNRELRKELQIHKELIKDLLYQSNSTMRSYLQMAELLELVIKIILKKGGCLDCFDNDTSDKNRDDSDEEDDDKTKKLTDIISKVKVELNN